MLLLNLLPDPREVEIMNFILYLSDVRVHTKVLNPLARQLRLLMHVF